MTTLTKPVSRETLDSYNILYPQATKARPIVVILYPDGTIGFREKGRRQVFRLPVDHCFRWAVRAEANRIKAEKKKNR